MSPVPQNQLGLFGPKTEAAVNAYKNKYLPSGNKGNNAGVVGDTTWAYIDRDYSKMTNSRQYQNEALIQANNNTDSSFNNTLKNLKNTNSPSPKPSSSKPSAVQTSPNKGTGNAGGEIIVASGQEGDAGRFKYNFIETAIKQINDYKFTNSGQIITWMIDKGSYSATDLKNFENTARKLGVRIIYVDSKQEFINYINTGSVGGNSNRARTISNFTLFGHGHAGELNFGSDYNITISDLSSLNKGVFNNTDSTFYSCNTGTGGDGSFAQAWSNLTDGVTKAMILKTDYETITYTTKQLEIIEDRWKIQRAWYKIYGEPDEEIAKIKKGRSKTGYLQSGSYRYPIEGEKAYWKTFTSKK